jgi:hypothetical protein
MKSPSRNRQPNIVNLTVKRRYLPEREIEWLMDCAQVWPLRASRRDHDPGRLSTRFARLGGCDLQWQQIDLSEGRKRDAKRASDPR